MGQNKDSGADHKDSEELLVDSVYDEQEIEKQVKEMQPIFASYVTEAVKNNDQSIGEWLTGRLKKDLPEKTDEQINDIVDDILQTVKIQEEKSTSLHEAINSGRSRESWFANECRKATSGMTAQEAGKYLQTVDDAVSRANEEMTKTIMTSAGQVSQNPSLHGFIAEQYHVQTFNQNAAAKGSQYHAEVLGPTDHGYSKNSVDIVIKDKNGKIVRRYQSKYCENSKLTERAFDSGDYRGQRKLVPSEQAGDLSEKNATDHIEAPDGTSSTPLSSEKAKEIQNDAQTKGDWEKWDWNSLSSKDLAKGIGKNVAMAGAIGAAAGVGFDIVDKLASGQEIDPQKEVETAVKSGGDFMVKTGAAAALKVGSEKGILTLIPKGTPMSTLTNIAYVGVETAKTCAKVSNGEYTLREGIDEIQTTAVSTTAGIMISTAAAAKVGTALGTVFGPVGTVVGGVVGGAVGYIAGSSVGKAVTKGVHKVRDAITTFVKKAYCKIKEGAESIKSSIRSRINWLFT